MAALHPEPTDVASLVLALVSQPWPSNPEELSSYTNGFHLAALSARSPTGDQSSLRSHWYTTFLGDQVKCQVSTFRDELLGVHFTVYEERGDCGVDARRGFAALSELLTAALGVPNEQWGTEDQPASLWRVGELYIEMYCFQKDPSGVLVGPSHAARNALHDSYHDAMTNRDEIAHPHADG